MPEITLQSTHIRPGTDYPGVTTRALDDEMGFILTLGTLIVKSIVDPLVQSVLTGAAWR